MVSRRTRGKWHVARWFQTKVNTWRLDRFLRGHYRKLTMLLLTQVLLNLVIIISLSLQGIKWRTLEQNLEQTCSNILKILVRNAKHSYRPIYKHKLTVTSVAIYVTVQLTPFHMLLTPFIECYQVRRGKPTSYVVSNSCTRTWFSYEIVYEGTARCAITDKVWERICQHGVLIQNFRFYFSWVFCTFCSVMYLRELSLT